MILIGKLNTLSKQEHFIFRFSYCLQISESTLGACKFIERLWLLVELKSACRVLAIAALLQGWLCVGVLCALQMCCNVRSPIRDFEFKVVT